MSSMSTTTEVGAPKEPIVVLPAAKWQAAAMLNSVIINERDECLTDTSSKQAHEPTSLCMRVYMTGFGIIAVLFIRAMFG